jgi:hypothetical protein
MRTKLLLTDSMLPATSVERKRTYVWQAVPTPQATETDVPAIAGVQVFAVSMQY